MEIKNFIEDWKNLVFFPQQNDILLQLHAKKSIVEVSEYYREEIAFSIPETPLLKKNFSEHQKSQKETGASIFGILKDSLHFQLDGREFETPFLLADASIQKNRFTEKYEISQGEDFYANPLLLSILNLDFLPEKEEEVLSFLENIGLKATLKKGIWVGNFHPHRFVFQKELDDLHALSEYSEPLKSLFGIENKHEKIELTKQVLFPADFSQLKALDTIKDENIVIQGPPGTGKSQVIANLVGKTLGVQKTGLVVAEKPVALKVIFDGLRTKDLHHFCLFYHNGLKAKNVVRSLEKTWKFIEQLPKENSVLQNDSELLISGLDFTLSRLRQKDLIGGISFSEFLNLRTLNGNFPYLIQKPEIKIWEKDKIILQELIKNNFPIYGSWLKIKFTKSEAKEWEEKREEIERILENISFENLTLDSLKEKIKFSHLISLFFYDNRPIPIDYFKSGSRKKGQIIKLYHQLKSLLEKENLLSKEQKNWNKELSLTEIEEYLTAFRTKGLFNYRSKAVRKKLLKLTDLSLLNVEKSLEIILEYYKIKDEIIAVSEKLRKANFPDNLQELEYLIYVINRVQEIEENELKSILELSENERINLYKNSHYLLELKRLLSSYFRLQPTEEILFQMQEIEKEVGVFSEFHSLLQQISEKTKFALNSTQNLEETEQAIYHSHWIDFKGKFPNLAELSGENIKEKLEQIVSRQSEERENFRNYIQQSTKKKFEDYHILLQTPARKLLESEKELKKQLRKGKTILVNAFNKKRSFPSLRELLESDAKLWIRLLHPIFLCNPYAVAKNIPIDFNFDIGIVDEASQIPLGNIIGSVQRSRRVVICGDQQQMPPSFYFQKKEKQQSDVLHYAEFYWRNEFLSYHYRSQHPELIAFSNRYFYNNELKTFRTKRTFSPIELVTLDGRFINRTNEKEAEFAAKYISKKIINNEFDFGLVAFSQTQLQLILDKIPSHYLQKLEGRQDVFLQNLENVQGDQCKHLIISLGYGKEEEGNFHLRFGPLNLEQGHRRLNVLMSRASEKITFIRSVSSSDFPISTNNGVEMLRKLLLFLEEIQDKNENSPPLSEKPVENGVIHLKNIASKFVTAQELLDSYRIYKSRGWEVEIGI